MSLDAVDYTENAADAVRRVLFEEEDGLARFSKLNYANFDLRLQQPQRTLEAKGFDVQQNGSAGSNNFAKLIRYMLSGAASYDLRGNTDAGELTAFGLPVFLPNLQVGYDLKDNLALRAAWEGADHENALFTFTNPQNGKQNILVNATAVQSSAAFDRDVDDQRYRQKIFKRYIISMPRVVNVSPGTPSYGLLVDVPGAASRKDRERIVTYVAAAAVAAMLYVRLVAAVSLFTLLARAAVEEQNLALRKLFDELRKAVNKPENDAIAVFRPNNNVQPDLNIQAYDVSERDEAAFTQLKRVSLHRAQENYARYKWQQRVREELDAEEQQYDNTQPAPKRFAEEEYDAAFEDTYTSVRGVQQIIDDMGTARRGRRLCKALAIYCRRVRDHPFLTDKRFESQLRDAYEMARARMIDEYRTWSADAVTSFKSAVQQAQDGDLYSPFEDVMEKQSPLGQAIVLFNVPNLGALDAFAQQWRAYSDAPLVASEDKYNGVPRKDFKIADGRYYPERIARYMDTAVQEAKSRDVKLDLLSRRIRAAQREQQLIKEPYAAYWLRRAQLALYLLSQNNYLARASEEDKRKAYQLFMNVFKFPAPQPADYNAVRAALPDLAQQQQQTALYPFLKDYASRSSAERLLVLAQTALLARATDRLEVRANAVYASVADAAQALLDFYAKEGAERRDIDVNVSVEVELERERLRLQQLNVSQAALRDYVYNVLDQVLTQFNTLTTTTGTFTTQLLDELRTNVRSALDLSNVDTNYKSKAVFETLSAAWQSLFQAYLLSVQRQKVSFDPAEGALTVALVQELAYGLRALAVAARAAAPELYDASDIGKRAAEAENVFAQAASVAVLQNLNEQVARPTRSELYDELIGAWREELSAVSSRLSDASKKNVTVFVPLYTREEVYDFLFNRQVSANFIDFYRKQEQHATNTLGVNPYQMSARMLATQDRILKLYAELRDWEISIQNDYNPNTFVASIYLDKMKTYLDLARDRHKQAVLRAVFTAVVEKERYTRGAPNEEQVVAEVQRLMDLAQQGAFGAATLQPGQSIGNVIYDDQTTIESQVRAALGRVDSSPQALMDVNRLYGGPAITIAGRIYKYMTDLRASVNAEAAQADQVLKWRRDTAETYLREMLALIRQGFESMDDNIEYYFRNLGLIGPSEFADMEAYVVLISRALRFDEDAWLKPASPKYSKIIEEHREAAQYEYPDEEGKGKKSGGSGSGGGGGGGSGGGGGGGTDALKVRLKELENEALQKKIDAEERKRQDEVNKIGAEQSADESRLARVQEERELQEAKHQNELERIRLQNQNEQQKLQQQRQTALAQEQLERTRLAREEAAQAAQRQRAIESEQSEQAKHERQQAQRRLEAQLAEQERRDKLALELEKQRTQRLAARHKEQEARNAREYERLKADERRLQEASDLQKMRVQRTFADQAHREKMLENQMALQLKQYERQKATADLENKRALDKLTADARKAEAEAKKIEAEAKKSEAETKKQQAQLNAADKAADRAAKLQELQLKQQAQEAKSRAAQFSARVDREKMEREIAERKRQEQLAARREQLAAQRVLNQIALEEQKQRSAQVQTQEKLTQERIDKRIKELKDKATAADNKANELRLSLQRQKADYDEKLARLRNNLDVSKLDAEARANQAKKAYEQQKRQAELQLAAYEQKSRVQQVRAAAVQIASFFQRVRTLASEASEPDFNALNAAAGLQQVEPLRQLFSPANQQVTLRTLDAQALFGADMAQRSEEQLRASVGEAVAIAIRLLQHARAYTAGVVRDNTIAQLYKTNAQNQREKVFGPLQLNPIDANLRSVLVVAETLLKSPKISDTLQTDPNLLKAVSLHAEQLTQYRTLQRALNRNPRFVNDNAAFLQWLRVGANGDSDDESQTATETLGQRQGKTTVPADGGDDATATATVTLEQRQGETTVPKQAGQKRDASASETLKGTLSGDEEESESVEVVQPRKRQAVPLSELQKALKGPRETTLLALYNYYKKAPGVDKKDMEEFERLLKELAAEERAEQQNDALLRELEDRLRTKDENIAALEADKKRLEEEKAAYEAGSEDLRAQLNTESREVVRLRDTAQAYFQQKNALLKQLEDQSADQVSLQKRLEAKEQQIQDTEEAQGNAETAVVNLNEKLQIQTQRAISVENQLAQVNAEIEQRALNLAAQRTVELQDRLDRLGADKAGVDIELQTLRNELNNIRNAGGDDAALARREQQRAEALQRQLDTLTLESERQQKSIADKEAELARAQAATVTAERLRQEALQVAERARAAAAAASQRANDAAARQRAPQPPARGGVLPAIPRAPQAVPAGPLPNRDATLERALQFVEDGYGNEAELRDVIAKMKRLQTQNPDDRKQFPGIIKFLSRLLSNAQRQAAPAADVVQAQAPFARAQFLGAALRNRCLTAY